MKKTLFAALGAALLAGVAPAQFTVDGSKDAAYPASNQFQTVNTQFGDSVSGQVSTAGGSELDGVFANLSGGFLNILFTGNLETNFNRLNVFFDAPGIGTGQNVVSGTDYNGLTFDSGFAPDFLFVVNGDASNFYVDYYTLVGGTATSTYLGSNDGQNGGVLAGGTNPSNVLAARNNSNTAGVGPYGTDPGQSTGLTGDPTAVTTGIEFQIPTSLIGNVDYGSGVLVSAFISGGGFLSNQVLGGAPANTPNLGNASGVNFNNVTGNQYFAVPEPASMAAIALGLGGLLARRRRA
jgi:hypothetical protein